MIENSVIRQRIARFANAAAGAGTLFLKRVLEFPWVYLGASHYLQTTVACHSPFENGAGHSLIQAVFLSNDWGESQTAPS